MPELDPNNIVTLVVLGLVGAAVGLRKLYGMWSKEGTIIQQSSAEARLYQILNDQLDKFATQNNKLAEEVSRLEKHNRELIRENEKIALELVQLTLENQHLRDSIARLEAKIDEITKDIEGSRR